MPPPQAPPVEVVAGSAFETLVALFARSDSELWLHLLGLALERPDDIVGAVRACPGDELRRHAVGVHVPAWQALVGLEALEATARGDTRLLDHECYYAGKARASLEAILPLSPEETKRWILGELELVRLDQELLAALERDAAAKRALALGAEEAIDLAAGGYRYEREPDMDRIVLVPHAAARPWLLLCQHDRTRIICYPLPEETSVEERAVALGRALGDDGRVRMLRRLARGDATLAELATEAGLAKSTAHHHLAQLRAAGLVTMHGNARGYRFTLRGDGVAAAHEILTRLTAP